MKVKTTIGILLIAIAVTATNCGKKNKSYVCTSPTRSVATQADYDNGYTPDKKTGYVGQEYMKGSDGVIHHKTVEEVNDEIATWEGEGYTCEWE